MAKRVDITITQGYQYPDRNITEAWFKCNVVTSGESWRGSGNVASLLILQDGNTIWYGEVTRGAPANSTTTMFEFMLEIQHKEDGSSGQITADFNYDSGWCFGTQHAVFTPLQRRTTIEVPDGTLGEPLQIKLNRYSENYTHKIEYGFGSLYETIEEDFQGDICEWTPPLDLASQIPHANVGWGGIGITTYNNGVQVGEKYTANMNLYIPNTLVPIIDDLYVFDSYLDSFGVLLQGRSKPFIDLDARGVYGSTVTTYETVIEDTTYNGDIVYANAIKGTGDIVISSRVKDTRGQYSEWKKVTFTSVHYENPKITSLVAKRCNENGTYNHQGAYFSVEFVAEVTSLDGKNTTNYELQYKKTTDTTYLPSLYTDDMVAPGKFIIPADVYSTYDILVRVYEQVVGTAQKTTKGYSARKLFDVWKTKFSIAFGKIAELENAFEVLFENIKLTGRTKVSVEGKDIDIVPSGKLLYKGGNFFGGRQLWSGQSLMNETHSITFDKPISEMKNGILLVFARGTYNLTQYFVPKEVVLAYTRTTFCFPLCTGMLDYIGAKTLHISDTKIEGHTDNDATGTNGISGITYHNELFYLVKVYEV